MGRPRHHARAEDENGSESRSPRQGHLEARLRRALQTILVRGLNDPRIRGLVSVTGFDLAPDQSSAVVHISVLPAQYGPLTIAGLQHAAVRLTAEIGGMVRARRLPTLRFELDDRLKKEAALDALLASDREESP